MIRDGDARVRAVDDLAFDPDLHRFPPNLELDRARGLEQPRAEHFLVYAVEVRARARGGERAEQTRTPLRSGTAIPGELGIHSSRMPAQPRARTASTSRASACGSTIGRRPEALQRLVARAQQIGREREVELADRGRVRRDLGADPRRGAQEAVALLLVDHVEPARARARQEDRLAEILGELLRGWAAPPRPAARARARRARARAARSRAGSARARPARPGRGARARRAAGARSTSAARARGRARTRRAPRRPARAGGRAARAPCRSFPRGRSGPPSFVPLSGTVFLDPGRP